MTGKSYRELLVECGYSEEMVAAMTNDDCKAEYVELSMGGHGE